jgi:hypothetical protein
LHHVKRSGKKKIWIPLERGTWVEYEELEGESEVGPWEILLLPILSLSLGWNFKSPLELREVKERRREGPPWFGRGESWWIMEEREERGVKERIFSLFGPRVEVGRHRSDRWRAPVRPVTALGRASEPLSVFPTHPR